MGCLPFNQKILILNRGKWYGRFLEKFPKIPWHTTRRHCIAVLYHQSKRKILKSTCPSDNHHREFGCPRPKSACPKRYVQTVFRNKINSTCGFWCILIYSNVNCELFTRVQMLLKIKKTQTFLTLLRVTHLIPSPCRHDDLIDSKTFKCFFLFNDILSLASNFFLLNLKRISLCFLFF